MEWINYLLLFCIIGMILSVAIILWITWKSSKEK